MRVTREEKTVMLTVGTGSCHIRDILPDPLHVLSSVVTHALSLPVEQSSAAMKKMIVERPVFSPFTPTFP